MNALQDQIYCILRFSQSFLEQSVASYFLWKLSAPFFQNNKGVMASSISYFIAIMLLWSVPIPFDSFFVYACGAAVAFLVMHFWCDGDIPIKFFLSITFFSIRAQGMSMVMQIHTDAFDLEAKFLNWITDGAFAKSWEGNMLHIAFYVIVDILLVYLVFSKITRFILQRLPLKNRKLRGKEVFLLLLPSISGMANYFIIHWLYNQADEKLSQRFFGPYPYMGSVVFFLYLTALASLMLVIALFSDLEKKKEEEKKQAALSGQMQEMRSHIREVEQLYQGIRGMKHDLRNHITAMEGLMEKGEYKEAQAFLGSMEKAMENLEYAYQTGNPVTDVILNEKYNQAKRAMVEFEADFHFPLGLQIDVFDLSIILSNALENALEAARQCQKKHGGEKVASVQGYPAPVQRYWQEREGAGHAGKKEGIVEAYIKVSSRCRKQAWLLTVENSFQGELAWDPEGGLPKSSKGDPASHGMGLKNIRSMAEKYFGDIDIEAAEGRFVLTVMLLGNHTSYPGIY